jgi:VPDSG-CTERM motif
MKTIAILAVFLGLIACQNTFAIPTLQLDASPATYDKTSETTISEANQFTLYAMLNSTTPDSGASYYVIAGLQPQNAPAQTLGSFVYDGTTVYVTGDMTSGKPFGWNNKHGIYPTYYKTFQVDWSSATPFDNYDVSLVTGTHTGPTSDPSGTSLYAALSVDISGLAAGTKLWYDLVEVQNGEVVGFAPFSHVDQSGGTGTTVPDGGSTIGLLGLALGALAGLRRRV